MADDTIIDSRLHALGHPADYVTDAARTHLIAQSAGSPHRLRANLAAVLFLASTEDAPAIDAALVQRALPATQTTPPPPHTPRTRAKPRPPILPVAFGIAVTTLLLAVLTWHPRQTPSTAMPQPVTPLQLTPAAQPRAATPPLPSPPPKSPPPKSPPQMPPAIAIGAPTLNHSASAPPASQPFITPPPEPAPPTQPSATFATPPTEVAASVLLIYPARSPAALARLKPLALALQHAGFTTIRARPTRVIPTRRAISFFYSEDAARAQLIANLLATSGWPHLDRNSLQPSLVLVPAGLPPRSPGELEIQLP